MLIAPAFIMFVCSWTNWFGLNSLTSLTDVIAVCNNVNGPWSNPVGELMCYCSPKCTTECTKLHIKFQNVPASWIRTPIFLARYNNTPVQQVWSKMATETMVVLWSSLLYGVLTDWLTDWLTEYASCFCALNYWRNSSSEIMCTGQIPCFWQSQMIFARCHSECQLLRPITL